LCSGLFETCPSDFSFLRMESTPPSGGDTLWVSGYELFDRLSVPFQRFFETLTADCSQPVFKSACEKGGYEVMSPRGSPLNVDFEFSPHHPVIRTHPVTGWKTLFAGVGLHVSRIDGVTNYEDSMIREYVMRLITRNHDCIARMHWTRGACAIWSNVCTLHAATVSLWPFRLFQVSCLWLLISLLTLARYTPCRGKQDWCTRIGDRGGAVSGPGKYRTTRSIGITMRLLLHYNYIKSKMIGI